MLARALVWAEQTFGASNVGVFHEDWDSCCPGALQQQLPGLGHQLHLTALPRQAGMPTAAAHAMALASWLCADARHVCLILCGRKSHLRSLLLAHMLSGLLLQGSLAQARDLAGQCAQALIGLSAAGAGVSPWTPMPLSGLRTDRRGSGSGLHGGGLQQASASAVGRVRTLLRAGSNPLEVQVPGTADPVVAALDCLSHAFGVGEEWRGLVRSGDSPVVVREDPPSPEPSALATPPSDMMPRRRKRSVAATVGLAEAAWTGQCAALPEPLVGSSVPGGGGVLPPPFIDLPSGAAAAALIPPSAPDGSGWAVPQSHIALHSLVLSLAPAIVPTSPRTAAFIRPTVMLFGTDGSGNTVLVYSSAVAGQHAYPAGNAPVSVPLPVAATGTLLLRLYHVMVEGEDRPPSASPTAQRLLLAEFPVDCSALRPAWGGVGPFVGSRHIPRARLGLTRAAKGVPGNFSATLLYRDVPMALRSALRPCVSAPLQGGCVPHPSPPAALPVVFVSCHSPGCAAQVQVPPRNLAQAAAQASAVLGADEANWAAAHEALDAQVETAGSAARGPTRRRRSFCASPPPSPELQDSVGSASPQTVGPPALLAAVPPAGNLQAHIRTSRLVRAAGQVDAFPTPTCAVQCQACARSLAATPLMLPLAGVGTQEWLLPPSAPSWHGMGVDPASASEDEGALLAPTPSGDMGDLLQAVECATWHRHVAVAVRVARGMQEAPTVPPLVMALVCRESHDIGESMEDMLSTLASIADEVMAGMSQGQSLLEAQETIVPVVEHRAVSAGMRVTYVEEDAEAIGSILFAHSSAVMAQCSTLQEFVPEAYCGADGDGIHLIMAAEAFSREQCGLGDAQSVNSTDSDSLTQLLEREGSEYSRVVGAALDTEAGALLVHVLEDTLSLLAETLANKHGVREADHATALAMTAYPEGGGGGEAEESALGGVAALPSSVAGADVEGKCVVCCCEFVEGEALRHTSCLHTFHQACVDPWLASAGTCPICKTPVPGHLPASKDASGS